MDKPTIQIRNKLFIDGYHLYLNAKELAQTRLDFVTAVYQHADKVCPDLTVGREQILNTARSLFFNFETQMFDAFKAEAEKSDSKIGSLLDVKFHEISSKKGQDWRAYKESDHILDNSYEAELFAARPVDREKLKKALADELSTIRDNQNQIRIEHRLRENLVLLEEGKVRGNSKIKDLDDYEYFIGALSNLTGVEGVKFGISLFDKPTNGVVVIREKGVDAHLIMAAMDSLRDEELPVVGFVTNDSDYYPVIERLKRSSKAVYLCAIIPNKKFVSRALKNAVGDKNILNIEPHGYLWDVEHSDEFEEMRWQYWESEKWREHAESLPGQYRDFEKGFVRLED